MLSEIYQTDAFLPGSQSTAQRVCRLLVYAHSIGEDYSKASGNINVWKNLQSNKGSGRSTGLKTPRMKATSKNKVRQK